MSKAISVEMILTVPSVEETVEWYRRVLGWDGGYDVFDADGKCNFGGINGSGEDPMNGGKFTGYDLIRYAGDPATYRNENSNFTFLIYVEDVDALYCRIKESGWPTEGEPQNQFWGSRTLDLRDVNGFRLRLATRIEAVSLEEVQERYETVRK